MASLPGAGTALLAATREQGVVAKRLHSLYLPGRRTRNWLKTEHYQRETFLVGGFVTDHDEVRSLLVGLPDPGRPGRADPLRPGRPRPGAGGQAAGPGAAGAAGHRPEPVRRAPAALFGGRCSRPGPDEPAPVFVRPELAVEVGFLGWESGRLRHPAYGGLTRIL